MKCNYHRQQHRSFSFSLLYLSAILHTRTLTHPHTHTFSLSLSIYYSLHTISTNSISLSRSHTHIQSHTYTHTRTLLSYILIGSKHVKLASQIKGTIEKWKEERKAWRRFDDFGGKSDYITDYWQQLSKAGSYKKYICTKFLPRKNLTSWNESSLCPAPSWSTGIWNFKMKQICSSRVYHQFRQTQLDIMV